MRQLTSECIAALDMFLGRPPYRSTTKSYISHYDPGGNPVLTIEDEIACGCIGPATSDCPRCNGGFVPRVRRYSVMPFGSFMSPLGGIGECTPLDEIAGQNWYKQAKEALS